MEIGKFWSAVLAQDREAIREYFWDDAHVNWHCTNERFTVDEFIQANCEYPGQWDGELERVEIAGDTAITVVRVYPKNNSASFHVVSFIRIKKDKIEAVDEYWADDGEPPQWRSQMHIGGPIK